MMERNSFECLLKKLDEEIVLPDGAMGTMIQQHKLEEKDFRNEALADHPNPLQGNNDLLSITRPEMIEQIHTDYFFRVGVYPNAGLPNAMGAYEQSPGEFSRIMKEFASWGGST